MDLKSRDKWIAHVLASIPYKDVIPGKIKLLLRKDHGDGERAPHRKLHFVDEKS
jgi:hypothetical protein